jgi:hypothetical protein
MYKALDLRYKASCIRKVHKGSGTLYVIYLYDIDLQYKKVTLYYGMRLDGRDEVYSVKPFGGGRRRRNLLLSGRRWKSRRKLR